MSSEHRRIAMLRALYEPTGRGGVPPVLGIGDDAAVVESHGALVCSVDAAVEGVHFRATWRDHGVTLTDLGARATLAALSDLAAMGARPRAILSALVLPDAFDDSALLALARGVHEVATDHGAPVVGGNLARGSELSITTTVLGDAAGATRRRSGASPGDGLYVTGTIGAASLGLAALERPGGPSASAAPFVRRFVRPLARTLEGQRLVGYASAAIDVSDGLYADLGHLCAESCVGAVLELAEVPTLPGHVELAAELGVDPVRAILAGGDDYELLFASPLAQVATELATRIGRVTDRVGVIEVLDAAGARVEAPSGFDHFR